MAKKTLNRRISELENKIVELTNLVDSLSTTRTEKDPAPYGIVGSAVKTHHIGPLGPSGMGGGKMIWNDIELSFPKINEKPSKEEETIPVKGYNGHSHSRFSGGALDINTLEIVEYDMVLDENGEWVSDEYSKHSQNFWKNLPPIAVLQNSLGENVSKLGKLDLVFDANSRKWLISSAYIDVEKSYLVLKDSEGNIQTDTDGVEMKSPLYDSSDPSKSNIVWDTLAKCWRFYAVYGDD